MHFITPRISLHFTALYYISTLKIDCMIPARVFKNYVKLSAVTKIWFQAIYLLHNCMEWVQLLQCQVFQKLMLGAGWSSGNNQSFNLLFQNTRITLLIVFRCGSTFLTFTFHNFGGSSVPNMNSFRYHPNRLL